jgi:hypothetical protein
MRNKFEAKVVLEMAVWCAVRRNLKAFNGLQRLEVEFE